MGVFLYFFDVQFASIIFLRSLAIPYNLIYSSIWISCCSHAINVARIFAAGGGEVGCTLFWPPILTTFLVVSVLTIQNTHTPPKLNTAPSSTQ